MVIKVINSNNNMLKTNNFETKLILGIHVRMHFAKMKWSSTDPKKKMETIFEKGGGDKFKKKKKKIIDPFPWVRVLIFCKGVIWGVIHAQ